MTIKPYTRHFGLVRQPEPRPAPVAPKPTPTPEVRRMTPNALWLDTCAAYWQAQGYTLHWLWNKTRLDYDGFVVFAAGRGDIASVRLFE